MMREDFLHYIWKLQLLSHADMRSTDHESITIINQGQQNFDGGPDFFNAKIKIDKQLWAGNVELHVKASDWYVHHHERDSKYDSVILHVVWENDLPILRKDGTPIPTLILKDYVRTSILKNYKTLFEKKSLDINCASQITDVDQFTIDNWLEALYIERLSQKSDLITGLLQNSNNDWEAVLFVLLTKNFGLKVNGDAFYQLAKSIDFKMIRKLNSNILELESLLFGQANALDIACQTPYFLELKKTYKYLKQKFKLEQSNVDLQFFRLRPDNFPTIRLAQLSALYHKHQQLFSKIIQTKDINAIYEVFDIAVSDFWQNHYTFQSETKVKRHKKLSKAFIDLVIINTVMPLQFMYFKQKGKDHNEVIINMMNALKPEKNSIVTQFQTLGIEAESAFKTQALIQLKNDYCSKNRCLHCKIGHSLLKQNV